MTASRRRRSFLPTLLMTALAVTTMKLTNGQSPCTICENGDPVSLPDTILALPGFPPLQCQSVDTTLSFLIPNATSSDCKTIQQLGSLCGCPAAVTDDSCLLCPSSNGLAANTNELPFFAHLFLGYTPTCEILEAYLASQSKDDAMCFVSQSFIGEYCGCSSNDNIFLDDEGPESKKQPCSLCPGGEPAFEPDKNISMPDLPFETCGQLEEALSLLLKDGSDECNLLSQAFASFCSCAATITTTPTCSLCRDGSPVAFPNQPVELLKDEFGGIVPTCAIYESYVAGIDDTAQCSTAQMFGTICGCPPIDDDHCVFCPGESMPADYLDKTIGELAILYDFTMTCGDAEAYLQYQIQRSSHECFLAQHANHLCGCNGGLYTYLGANTVPKQAALAWMPRISAFLSFVGSLLIIWDILSSENRKKAVYSQLILGMSIFDLIGSVAWGLSTLPIPEYNEYGRDTLVYGAMGTDATCMAQGFVLQLNFTAVFYNISLSTYYLLVIVHGWRDNKLKRNRWWLHGLPLSIGVGLAFGGLPFYKNAVFACHIQNPPIAKTWYPIVFLVFVPIFSAILFTTGMMVRVYLKVRKQSRKAARWKFPSFRLRQEVVGKNVTSPEDDGRSGIVRRPSSEEQGCSTARPRHTSRGTMGNLEREVFYQSLFYLFVFYLCWIFLLVATLEASPSIRDSLDLDRLYGFFVAALAIAPLQGFWNCCVYFRPRIIARWAAKATAARQRTDGGSPSLAFLNFFRSRTNSSGTGTPDWESDRVRDGGNSDRQEINEPYDPSAAIAMLDSQSCVDSSIDGTDDGAGGSSTSANLMNFGAIREELEELEHEEDQIEAYFG